ncbi:glycosyltransferase [Limnospira fusiformis KN01]|uniref:Glycosyl transferase family 2 n=3 Tax=Limnospira TaxID=2596745 RepID=B5VVB3_LIMMA|nr:MULTISPECIES: glycosyltransferase [Limnospira]MDC0836641.1 glycosyltransferase [Limnoraphis robusta]EDZ96956.1 glycosyl transferase family 2 [Limnospira maxima CS-328]MDT9188330.1 glycosyltransferase [Limnospira sp. PMC 894.15]MDT9198484.1 glycosyltransferase [Limnospira sp. PMC 1042.18]MDT9234148.1 glycosyltransferase [Limnospira sp. PMC 917.15]
MSATTRQPRVSVIIPAYNADRYIAEAINSIFSQSYQDYEIIVVDDGSTDSTPEILQSYGSRIHSISQTNGGIAAARNLGIAAAKGELIALLDHDDIFLADKLPAQVACFDSHPGVGLVNSGWQIISADGTPQSNIEPWHKVPTLTLETWLTDTPILPSAMMFRREWWEKAGGFDSRFDGADDVDFVLRLAKMGCEATWLKQMTVGYRQHDRAMSIADPTKQLEAFNAVLENFFQQPDLDDSIRQLERQTRYESLTWMAWRFYYTGHPTKMAEFLRRSLSYSPYTLPITVSDWIHRFIGYCTGYGELMDTHSFRQQPEWQQLLLETLPKTTPKVSVIIPAYNCDRYIELCVRSALEQTYTDYEIIVIDDGSTDNTRQVIEPYLDVISYHYQPNQGAAKARNYGCSLARGEFLAFLDGDDFFVPEKLAEQVAHFQKNPSIDLIQSGWMVVDQNSQILAKVTPWENAPVLNLETWVLYKCVRPSALIMRREWWEKVGGFDHRHPPTEDLDFVLRLSLMGCRTVWLKKMHACYRQHDSNLMSGGEKVIRNTEALMNEFFRRPELPISIRKLERKERYERWIWLAWRMYRDGYPKLMAECLQNSLEYSDVSPVDTLLHWTNAFQNISQEYGEKFLIEQLIKIPEWQEIYTLFIGGSRFRKKSQLNLSKSALMNQHIILINTDDPGIGGLAQYDHLIMCELAKIGYQVTAVRPKHTSPLVEQEGSLGVQQFWLDYSTSSDLARVLRNCQDYEKLYSQLKPDFIIFSDGWPYSHFAAKQVAIEQKIPYAIALGLAMSEHADFSMGDDIPYREAVRYQYGLARVVNVAAREHLNILHQDFKLPENKGNVVYYGRSPKYFNPPDPEARKRLRQEISLPEDAVMCFTSARLAPIKGHRHQLEAIAHLKNSPIWSKLYLVWAGTGKGSDRDVEPELREMAQQLGVAEKVIFLGQRWDVPDWLDACDIFVLTSYSEAAPSFAIMEAMAKGLPIVASAAGGIPEGLGGTGKLLPNPNVDPAATARELAHTLEEWAVNPQLRQAMGQASKLRAEQLFREERMLRETINILHPAISAPISDEFAQCEEVIKGVQNLSHRLRYRSQTWQAWHAYTTGDTAAAVEHLQRSLKYSPFQFTTQTILDWVNDFVRLYSLKGDRLDALSFAKLIMDNY